MMTHSPLTSVGASSSNPAHNLPQSMIASRVRTTVFRLIFPCLMLAVTSAASAAERIGWMYEADVPVMNQSPQARAAAAQEGFRQVLGRLTGLGDALTLNVAGMNADRLVSRFSFHSETVDGRRQPRIKFTFNPSQTLSTVRRAGLPVWGSSRPVVRFYLLVEGADGLWRPLAKGDPAELAMQRQAWVRGIRFEIKTFDENTIPVRQMLLGEPEPADSEATEPNADASEGTANFAVVEPVQSAVDAGQADLAEGATDAFGQPLTEAPEPPPEPFLPGVIPLETELVVVGELRAPPAPTSTDGSVAAPLADAQPAASPAQASADVAGSDPDSLLMPVDTLVAEQFRFAWGPARGAIRIGSGSAEEQAVELIDRVADRMAEELGVPWVSPQTQLFSVAGVQAVADYATLMRYLGRLEYVEQITLLRSAPDRLDLSLVTPAAPELLDRLFLVDGLLARDMDSQSTDRFFLWQD